MFNDLNNPNNPSRPAVDDIFAETDKTPESAQAAGAPRPAAGGAEIDAQKIGLTATDEFTESAPEKKKQDMLFKVIIAVIGVVVLGLAGYLIYTKFFNAPAEEPAASVPAATKPAGTTQTTVTPTAQTGSFVEVGSEEATTMPTTGAENPVTVGTTASATTTQTVATTTAAAAQVDSDNDGLTDAEERVAGTNINIIDTDNDGLSDYEEVKIYKTNPLSADTDGDGYLDGAEVKSGYNPNGAGKLSETVSQPVK